MVVTWTTFAYNQTFEPFAAYGLLKDGPDRTVAAVTTTFRDGGSLQRQYFMHRATMSGLTEGAKYLYHVGSKKGISELFYFQAMPPPESFAPRFAVYGDMGNINAQSLERLQIETQKGMYDAILHVGDFAYDMDSENGTVGDSFMTQIQSVAAYVPYMVCPGNHEQAYNFSHYKHRFSMPGRESGAMNLFYSIDIGPAHIISYNTEAYYYWAKYGVASIATQLNWLKEDLKRATTPESLKRHPWVIVMAHRPMYCSNDDGDCPQGFKRPTRYALEKLFCDYGVDLHIYAHEHSYERLWPVYDGKVLNGSTEEPYTNPGAPVHVVTGSAGCQERVDPFWKPRPSWSAVRISDYGYTRMHIMNSTHLSMEQVSDDKKGEIVDRILIKKSSHGPGTYKCHSG